MQEVFEKIIEMLEEVAYVSEDVNSFVDLDDAIEIVKQEAENDDTDKRLFYNKLKEYEDLEEQGLLLKLPCRVGDTVYCIYERYTKCSENEQEFDEYSCQGCECLECDSHKEFYINQQKAYSLDWIVTNLNNFGKTVFLTKERAEESLQWLQSEVEG